MRSTSIPSTLAPALVLAACQAGAPSSFDARVDSSAPRIDSGTPAPTEEGTLPSTSEPEILTMTGFSYVRDGVAGMPLPHGSDLDFLAAEGVELVVSLTEHPVDGEELAARGLTGLHLPIVDFQPPAPYQQLALVEELQARRGEKVAVHCLAGLGRTGTMLATWFVAEGATANDAIEEIRALRPGSIETTAQEDAVRRFARSLEER